MKRITLPAFFLAVCCVAADYKAGTARVDITPDGPIRLSGYASRNKPSEGMLQRLWAKALALEDRKGGKVVIVTTDLIGLTRGITDLVGARVEKEYGIDRARLLLNSSHTHTGPAVRPNLRALYGLSDEEGRVLDEYRRRLTDQLVSVAGAAVRDMKPANVSYGTGTTTFATNRRERTPEGVKLGVNPNGPVDHSVPVLRVTGEKGEPIAALFGYACHNTTLTGEHYKISGDYAGAAQAGIEKAVEGATAMFVQLCAGDQNPNPRGREEHVWQHGAALTKEVLRVAGGKLDPVRGEVRAALQWRDLPLAPYERTDFEKMLSDRNAGRVALAKEMLRAFDERRPIRSVSFPVQALRIGRNMVIVALGGEPVVEYALQIKSSYPKLRLVVAGYSNDVMGYLPTARMLKEGGYEPIGSTTPYGLPAPFTPEVERTVLETMKAVIERVR